MQITPFAVEQWMNEWETRCAWNLAETCVDSLTIAELLDIAGKGQDLSDLLPLKMTYGAIEGSDRLRAAIAALYTSKTPDQVITTHGTIGANMLVHKTLVSAGDRVVTILPTYQQHTAIPQSIGADVLPLHLKPEDGYAPDLDALRALAAPGTRLIAINNPNNPTGALMEGETLAKIAQIAEDAGAYVLCDEVYRGINQSGDGTTASMADIYDWGISTCSTSKAFALAGLRLGWVAAPRDVIDQIALHRDYDTISMGRVDDHLAALALENADAILARSRAITRSNLAILSDWMDTQPRLTWVPPRSGTTTLLHYDMDIPSRDLCVDLLQTTGVMFTPGSAFGLEGCFRIGFANAPEAMTQGLARVGAYLAALSE
ncbi:aminotransferase class I/II-fold pyridoxal phosphate-dependent enzyme [Alphaproteobacteria bacterium KMM 3653]|uniref:Aminotransferase n=1 Tax=Harenicola maris TaxID=2841044 RepID=A0AAP2CQR2_9RHOB|nr:aminotransferase class I/II-fold pyridoxal phosphate-dependent enzyme [Harenicola maris]